MYIIVVSSVVGACIATLSLIRALMKWSNEWCTSKTRMEGKVAIVTGGNTGIGYETARALALRGAKVILACRNERRGLRAVDSLISATRNKNIEYRNLDLCSLDSIRRFAKDLSSTEPRVHVLINNAGIHGGGERKTSDGILVGLQVNYFAPFLLSLLLLPLLKSGRGRIVNVASLCHFLGEVKLEKFNRVGAYGGNATYSNSKLAQVIFTKEMARRLSAASVPVTINALHPGVIHTSIMADSTLSYKIFFTCWCWLCNRNVEEGAQTSIYLSVAEEVANISGEYFVDCGRAITHWKVFDKELAKRLWEYSEKLVNCAGVLPPCDESDCVKSNGNGYKLH